MHSPANSIGLLLSNGSNSTTFKHTDMANMLKFKASIRKGEYGMVIDGLSISETDLLGFSPNSHQQPSIGFTYNSPEKKSEKEKDQTV